jgi:MSHA biogenesis protein MshO
MQAGHISRSRGFTLGELIIVIVILGIMGSTFGVFIVPAVLAHRDLERRAALVDSADIALKRMTRDIRIALPNSLRVTSNAAGFALEMIPTVDGGRYCTGGTANCAGGAQNLSVNANDDEFDILGCFRSSFKDAAASTDYRLVVGDTDGSAYTATGSTAVITPAATAITVTTVAGGGAGVGACGASSGANTSYRHHVQLSAPHRFGSSSGRQRVYVIQKPVSYICDKTAATLKRYSEYTISSAAPTPASPPGGATIALVTDKISDCSVSSSTSDVQTNGYVILSVTLANFGETVQLVSAVQFDNSP